ncbi:36085_t:CDS:1, partial [Gigaspora margarita]
NSSSSTTNSRQTLKIDRQPANLFDLDRNGKPIPMPQASYHIEKVVTVIANQLQNWNIQTGQNRVLLHSKVDSILMLEVVKQSEHQISLMHQRNRVLDRSGALKVILHPSTCYGVGNILSRSKFEEMDGKFKDVYFANGTSVQLGWIIDLENKEIQVYKK